jgi:hypothetical protein
LGHSEYKNRNRINGMNDVMHQSLKDAQAKTSVPLWLGLRIDGQKMALSMSKVSAVFRSHMPNDAGSSQTIDVEVHGGGPVFMIPIGLLFNEATDTIELEPKPDAWVVVLSRDLGENLGVRVDQVHGPFQAQPADGLVMDRHESWQVLTPRLQHA